MSAFRRPFYSVRRAKPSEAGLIGYLRLASLLCLEMPSYSLATIKAVMEQLPDMDCELAQSGRYFVADHDDDLLGGAGWSVLPLSFRSDRLVECDGGRASLIVGDDAVMVRGFFLDPDLGRRGAGASLLTEIELDAARAGYAAAELIAPASSHSFYRSLGFRPVRRLSLVLDRGSPLPIMHMRRPFPVRLATAA